MSMAIALWSFSYSQEAIAAQKNIAYIWDRLLYSGCIFIPSTFFHFVMALINLDREKRKTIISFYLVSFVFLILNYTPWFSTNVIPKWAFKYSSLPGPVYPYFVAFFLAVSSYAVIIMLSKYRKMNGEEKSRVKYVFIGAVLALIGGSMNYLFLYNVSNTAALGNYFVSAYTVFLAFAITKHELMDIRMVVNKTAAWIVTALFYGGIYLGLVWAYRKYISRQTDWLFIIWSMLFGILIAETFTKIRLFLQTTVETKFIKGFYNSDKVIKEIAEKLVPVLEIEQAVRVVRDQLKAQLQIEKIEILLLKKGETEGGNKFIALDSKPDTNMELMANDPFIKYFTDNKAIVLTNNLPSEIKEQVKKQKNLFAALYLPLFSSDELEAIMLVGPKASENPYNSQDLTLFETIKSQLIMVFDRIRPYEKIKKEFEANQKKLYDTDRLLARSEKIAALANLIQEYNHELKTPLAIIKSETERLPKQARDATYLEWFTNLVMKHLARANDIIESTLRLSKPKQRQEIEIDLNSIIEEALKVFPPNGVHLEKELKPLPKMLGDKDDLISLFVNLIKNAVEAMPEGGNLKIATYSGTEDNEPAIYAEVTDTGCGIPQENMEKIFEPFFSTHVTKGRGLGLSVSYRIIREHLGKIEVKSTVGAGSTFKIQFPAKKS